MQTKNGCDGAPVSTIEERIFFNRLMSANPRVGTKAGCSWDKFVDLWHNEVKQEAKGIYGKTSEQLKRHHAHEWAVKNAKLKAVRESSDALPAPVVPSSGSSWTWI